MEEKTKVHNVIGKLLTQGEGLFVIGSAPVDKEIFGKDALGFTVVRNVNLSLDDDQIPLYAPPFYLVVLSGNDTVFTADYFNLPAKVKCLVSELEVMEEKPTDIEPDEEPETNPNFE